MAGLGTNRDFLFRTKSKPETTKEKKYFEIFVIFEILEMLILSNANAMQS